MPSTIEVRETGATSISRRKPNSRSHTIEMAEKMAVKRTAMLDTPGKMKVGKLTPATPPASVPAALKLEASPEPKMNRDSTGCISDVRIRTQSRR